MWNDSLAKQEHAAQINIKHAVPAVGVDLHDLKRLSDAGIVDQDVDMAEAVKCDGSGTLAGGAISDIAGDANMAFPQRSGRLVGRC